MALSTTLTVRVADQIQTVTAEGRRTQVVLSALLRQAGVSLNTRCGQRGLCDGCLVDLLSGLVRQPLPAAGMNFLKLVVANQRLAVLPEVALQFRQLKNEAEGVADCLIETAFPLSDAEGNDLLAALAKRFGTGLRPSVQVNPALIGGVRIAVGDQVLDSSVRARLNQMQTALTA